MSMDLGTIHAGATFDVGNFASGVTTCKSRLQELMDSFREAAAQSGTSGKSFGQAMSDANNSINEKVSSIKDKLLSLKSLITTVVTGYAGKKLFDFTLGNAAQFEQYQTSFAVMMGSADKAKQKLRELSDYANTTPFQLPEVVQAGRTLYTFGLTTQDWVRSAGNLAAAANVNIGEVAMALGRIKAGDFGEAFERLRDFGISKQMLEGQGLKFDKSGQYVGSVDQALKAVQTIIQTRYGDMTNQQGKTFNGLVSTFQDAISQFGRDIGEKAFPMAKQALNSLMTTFDTMKKNGSLDAIGNIIASFISKIAEMIPKLVSKLPQIATTVAGIWKIISPTLNNALKIVGNVFTFMSQHVDLTKALLSSLGAVFVGMKIGAAVNDISSKFKAGMDVAKDAKGVVSNLGTAFMDLKTAPNAIAGIKGAFTDLFGVYPKILLIVAAIAAIGFAVYEVITHWKQVSAFFIGLWDGIKNIFNSALKFIVGSLTGQFNTASSVVKTVWNGIGTFFTTVWNGIKTVAVGIWTALVNTAKTIWNGLGAFFTGLWNGIKTAATASWNGIKIAATTVWNGIVTVVKAIIIPFVTFFITAWKNMQTGVQTIMNGLKTFFTGVWELIVTIFKGPILLLTDLWPTNWGKMGKDIQLIMIDLQKAFVTIWAGIQQIFVGVGQAIVAFLVTTWTGIVNTAKAIWNGLVTFFVWLWNVVKNSAIDAWNGLVSSLKSLWADTVNVAKTVWNALATFFPNLWNGIKNAAIAGWGALRTGVISICDATINWIKTAWNNLLNFFRNLPGTFYNLGVSIFTALRNGINSVLGTLGGWIRSAFNGVVNFFRNLPGEALRWGADMIKGFINGIKSMFGAIGKAVSGLGDSIRKQLHFSAPDEGPLADYETWMPDMIQGMIKGINNNKSKLSDAVKNMATDMTVNLHPQLSTASGMLTTSTLMSSTESTQQQPQIINQYDALIKVEHMDMNNGTDAKQLMQEAGFYAQQQKYAKGKVK